MHTVDGLRKPIAVPRSSAIRFRNAEAVTGRAVVIVGAPGGLREPRIGTRIVQVPLDCRKADYSFFIAVETGEPGFITRAACTTSRMALATATGWERWM